MLTRGYPAGALVRRGGDYEGVFEPYGDERVPPKRLSRPLVMMRREYSGCFFGFFYFLFVFLISTTGRSANPQGGGGGRVGEKRETRHDRSTGMVVT